MPRNKYKASRWNGARYFADKTVDALYWFKSSKGWRLIEETVTEIQYCDMFAHEQAGFFRGARVHRS